VAGKLLPFHHRGTTLAHPRTALLYISYQEMT